MTMTSNAVTRRMIGFGTIGLIGWFSVIAMAADEASMAKETFIETAERFGIFAALSIALTVIAVGGLVWMTHYVICTLQACVDDNTSASLRLQSMLKTRPCLHDSDIDRLDGDSGDEIVQRVEARRASRKARTQ